jgi:hypothetical protein
MAYLNRKNLSAALLLAAAVPAAAEVPHTPGIFGGDSAVTLDATVMNSLLAKSASTSSVASRGTVNSAITMYGGFEPAVRYSAIIVIRGPSLGTLGITQNYLDSPLACVYSGSTQLVCANSCAGATFQPVRDYYANVRQAPLSTRDACIVASQLPAGAYTFTINPSSISTRTGEILFEVLMDAS